MSASETASSRRRSNGRANQLSDAEKFLLWKELQSSQSEFVSEGPSVADVAARMSRCLSFPVTVSNIESAIEAGVVYWTPREVEERRDRQGHALGLPQIRSTLEDISTRLTCLENEREDEADALEDVREQVGALVHRITALEDRLEAVEAVLTTPVVPSSGSSLNGTNSTQPAACLPVSPAKPLAARLPPLPAPFTAALAQPVKPMTRMLFHGVGGEQAWKCGSYRAFAAVCVDRGGKLLWGVLLQHAEGCDAMSNPRRKILDRVLDKASRITRRILRRVGKGEVVLAQGFDGASAVGLRPMSDAEAALARTDTVEAAIAHFTKDGGAA